MRVWHFTEEPYPAAWRPGVRSLRVNLPNEEIDPAAAADLYHRYLDEWLLADELGLDIFVNEHHSTATCMTASANLILAILARQTRRAQLLGLGFPIGIRPDPLRVAEELSMIDVISRGRLNMGFIKGVPYEFTAANRTPVRVMDRFWEAHDLIIKAMTTRDGPFSWEGEHFHYRSVNIWPRPWQQPHPPVWSSVGSLHNVKNMAVRGYTMATFINGWHKSKELFDEYRRQWALAGRNGPVPLERFAYLGMVAIGTTQAEAERRGQMVRGYMDTNHLAYEPLKNPPGFWSPGDAAKLVKLFGEAAPRPMVVARDGTKLGPVSKCSIAELVAGGMMFCGTPDQVYEQIVTFSDAVGGFGNLLMMGHGGALSHADTADSLKLFAREVLPRLQEYGKTAQQKAAA
jgi:alkanesulfonate monooxygenase SsuD/methylene tetrahydromethanopterin reductase-like flavin-dependent oxidoreductase (luciferase family)